MRFLLQNDLLKIMDGDVVEFGEEGKRGPLSVDCSRVSVVMLGAFEKLREGQARATKHIGFAQAPALPADGPGGIGYDGMRREIAGRVNRIVVLDPLSAGDYEAILRGPVLDRVQEAVDDGGAMEDALRLEEAKKQCQLTPHVILKYLDSLDGNLSDPQARDRLLDE